MIEWAIAQARQAGCGLVQLTSDKQRPGAIRFYESLGFTATHEGLKLPLLTERGAPCRLPYAPQGHRQSLQASTCTGTPD
jgi:hypothetical protein